MVIFCFKKEIFTLYKEKNKQKPHRGISIIKIMMPLCGFRGYEIQLSFPKLGFRSIIIKG